MKILFIARSSLLKNPGGDTIQILNTQKYLQQLNVEVDIKLTGDEIVYANYDLLHFFNIIRPADILVHIKKSNKPFVVSTIYVDYSEFDKYNRGGLSGLLFRYLNKDTIEYFKVLARFLKNAEPIRSFSYFFMGQRKAIKEIIRKSSMLLPNSYNEYRRLSSDYGIEHPYKVIPNAIDPHLFGSGLFEKDPNMIICVARIEGLKNQLSLIKAVNNSNYQLFLIGAASTNHLDYYKICKSKASRNVHFISFLKQEELLAYYRKAKVHVLPSWFETTGLSSLEAAAQGCNIVITDKGDTREYYGDHAIYCNPESPESIRKAIDAAMTKPVGPELMKKINEQYTWDVAAQKTFEAYKLCLEVN